MTGLKDCVPASTKHLLWKVANWMDNYPQEDFVEKD
jgi:hypothetical protein